MYEGRVPDEVYARMQSSRGAHTLYYSEAYTVATYAGVVAALALFVWWWRRLSAAPSPAGLDSTQFQDFAAIALTGVVTNAVVCAVLASSLDRFQSRVIWIVPFLALSAVALAHGRRTASDGVPPSHDRSAQGAAT